MAKWSDVLTLIATPALAGDTTENGFSIPGDETGRDVFANKKSVGYSEFYKSAQAGIKTDLKFDVHTLDYGGEVFAEYGGARYRVLRTYGSKNDEFTELTLTDLSEREAAPEDAGGTGAGEAPEGVGEDGDV